MGYFEERESKWKEEAISLNQYNEKALKTIKTKQSKCIIQNQTKNWVYTLTLPAVQVTFFYK